MECRDCGSLENFAKDTVEYFQKTGLVYPPNLSLFAERLAKRLGDIAYQKGREDVRAECQKRIEGILNYIEGRAAKVYGKDLNTGLRSLLRYEFRPEDLEALKQRELKGE